MHWGKQYENIFMVSRAYAEGSAEPSVNYKNFDCDAPHLCGSPYINGIYHAHLLPYDNICRHSANDIYNDG